MLDDAGFQETTSVSLEKPYVAPEHTLAYWKDRAERAEARVNHVDGLLAQQVKATRAERIEANATRDRLANFKGLLYEQLKELVSDDEIEREAADKLLEGMGLDPLAYKYDTTFVVTVRLDGLRRQDGKEIEFEKAVKALATHFDTALDFEHDWIDVESVEVESHEPSAD
jgi:heterodisulfide reductase subunit B